MSLSKDIAEIKKLVEDKPVFKPASEKELRARKEAMGPAKRYWVDFSYEVYGAAPIEAHSEEEALQLMYDHLEYYGLENLDIDYSNREFDTIDVEEEKPR